MINSSSNAEFSDSDGFRLDVANTLKNRIANNPDINDIKHFPIIHGQQSIYIMDWQKSEITFSNGIKKMLGYNSNEFNMGLALNFIHPDDIQIVNRIIQGIINYSVNATLLSSRQYLTMTFRVLKKDGTYIKVLRQSSPYQIDVDGKFISNLIFLTNITFLKTNESVVEWQIFSDEMDVSKFKETIYKEFVNFFTSRELQIIYLIQNHLTNTKIASQLFISLHTVVAHRKNILKKSNCKNAKELLQFCERNGIV